MLFAVKTLPFSAHWQGRTIFTAKSIKFPMEIDPKITWEPCRKNYNFYFYVANVLFDTAERVECLGAFLESYRLEKPPKIALHFSESIIIGIPIETGHLLLGVILSSYWPCHRAAGKMTPSKSYWVSEAELQDLQCRPHLPTFWLVFNRFANSDAAVASLATRNVLLWICPESLDIVACLRGPNHICRSRSGFPG